MGNESEERHRAEREAIAARMRAEAQATRLRQEAEHRRLRDEHYNRQLQELENNKRIARESKQQQKKQERASSQSQTEPKTRKKTTFKRFIALSFQLLIVILAWLIFLYSFTIKAYADLTGYECAKKCLTDLPFSSGNGYWRIYYFLFNLVNLLLGLSPIIAIGQIKNREYFRKLKWSYAIALIQVLSWPILHIILTDSKDLGIQDIQSGYYIWLLSIFITTCAAFKFSKYKDPSY